MKVSWFLIERDFFAQSDSTCDTRSNSDILFDCSAVRTIEHFEQERVLYAVDVWMSELEDDVAPYLPALFDLLVPVLEQGSADLQQHLLSATAAAAAAAGHAFRPYLAALVPRLQACLTLTDNDHLKARAAVPPLIFLGFHTPLGVRVVSPHRSGVPPALSCVPPALCA